MSVSCDFRMPDETDENATLKSPHCRQSTVYWLCAARFLLKCQPQPQSCHQNPNLDQPPHISSDGGSLLDRRSVAFVAGVASLANGSTPGKKLGGGWEPLSPNVSVRVWIVGYATVNLTRHCASKSARHRRYPA